MGFLLFIIALFLILPLTIINYCLVENRSGYFKGTAMRLDIFANREFRTLWNKALIKTNGYQFGNGDETISSALGKNQVSGTLTNTGKGLVWILDKIEKDHCLLAINDQFTQPLKVVEEPTANKPKRVFWELGSFVYAMVIFINENFDTISSLGLSTKTEKIIKAFGLIAYFLFTYFNFKAPKKS